MRRRRLFACLGLLLVVGVVSLSWFTQPGYGAAPRPPYHNRRFGFGLTTRVAGRYDVDRLNAGWYWNWRTSTAPELPELEYVQTIRLSPAAGGYTAVPTGTTLLDVVAARPGATWFIGNEPDCIWQDNLHSVVYARAYHDLYHRIKGADPTAVVGVGSIVQPTPQRLRYLDRVLAAYEAAYGDALPTDLWVIHNYILCETCFPRRPEDPFAWGACPVPDWPDTPPDAVYHAVPDHWRLDIFQQRVVAFRRWMRDRGYRDRPLIVSEYGTLFWYPLVLEIGGEDFRRTEEDAITFMVGSFDWMRSARDAALGYPADDNRLVQRWAWYSLNHDGDELGGALFDRETGAPRPLGEAYATYTAGITPTVDLHLRVEAAIRFSDGGTVDVPLTMTLSNAGNLDAGTATTVTLSSGDQLVAVATAPPLPAWGADSYQLALTWPDRGAGAHPFCVRAVASSDTAEVCSVVLVNPAQVFLPVSLRRAP